MRERGREGEREREREIERERERERVTFCLKQIPSSFSAEAIHLILDIECAPTDRQTDEPLFEATFCPGHKNHLLWLRLSPFPDLYFYVLLFYFQIHFVGYRKADTFGTNWIEKIVEQMQKNDLYGAQCSY